MFEGFEIWKLLAGLGIFLFGMFQLEESIRELSGRAFKKLIRRYTTGKIKSIFSGLFVTSILQSSSAVSLMVLAFVGASIMTMENAIGVILGSNLGTTVTAWIVASVGFKLKIESFALPLIGIGGLGIIFLGQSKKYSNISKLLVGFGFIFMGLDYMKVSVEVFTENFDITTIPNYGIIVYLLVGILLTALMQSSSATMAIVLTSLNAGILDFNASAAMVIGANVGTTITIMLGAIGGVQVKKRVAFSHFTFNLVTGIIALLLMPFLIYLILQVFKMDNDPLIGLALFHTIFNLVGVIAFFPFIKLLARFLTWFYPDRNTDLTHFISNTTPEVAEAGISALKNETLYLIENVLQHNLAILNIDKSLVFSGFDMDLSESKTAKSTFSGKYEDLKLLQGEIFSFSAGIQSKELTEIESGYLNHYLHAARMALHSAKTLKDIKHNLDDFESSENFFLNEQYAHFRKRLVETYLKINHLIDEEEKKVKPKSIAKVLKNVQEDDRDFVSLTTKAINKKQISELEVSTPLIVNRAFVQSAKMLLLALRELLLDEDQLIAFEQDPEIKTTISELG